jgi:hypothetical protein
MKKRRTIIKDEIFFLDLPSGRIAIGPGTVPDAPGSVEKTDIKKVIAAAREASRLGIYESAEKAE